MHFNSVKWLDLPNYANFQLLVRTKAQYSCILLVRVKKDKPAAARTLNQQQPQQLGLMVMSVTTSVQEGNPPLETCDDSARIGLIRYVKKQIDSFDLS